jgi:ABC-2 type transport system ATP-binding protein
MATVIETHRLTKRYGAARGIEELDLRVDAGQVFGFLGPNGAGKSTTIRTLLDFQRATSGAAELFGLDTRLHSVTIRRRVGYVPGDLRLFDAMTGAQHLDWFSRARGGHDPAVSASLIDRFSITMDRPVRELSKGNRQKVGLLLAFMSEPELLILDEPTSGLDPLVQAEFEALSRDTADSGRTIFLSSHSLDEVQRVADRVAVIREGRLVVTDTVEHLRRSAPRIMTIQFERPVDPTVFASLPEVVNVTARDDQLMIELNGDLRPVLERALANGLVDLTSRHADLEELFLSYYRDPDKEAAST